MFKVEIFCSGKNCVIKHNCDRKVEIRLKNSNRKMFFLTSKLGFDGRNSILVEFSRIFFPLESKYFAYNSLTIRDFN